VSSGFYDELTDRTYRTPNGREIARLSEALRRQHPKPCGPSTLELVDRCREYIRDREQVPSRGPLLISYGLARGFLDEFEGDRPRWK
jgi:hypothetical protein